jgi:hypothetical protein
MRNPAREVMYPTGGEVHAAPSCPVQPGLPEGASLSCER